MRPLLLSVLFGVPGLALAQPPAGYYNAAQGLTGEPLRQALHDIIDDHSMWNNSQLWSAFAAIDRKPNTKVWDMYSDVPGGPQHYEFTFVTQQCSSSLPYDSEGDCFNREHTFPESWFGAIVGPSTDLFHIYPTDAWVNQKRGNWPYGTVGSNISFEAQNGGKLGQCNYPGCSGTVFEPIDAYKGDLARGYFYMLTRYKDEAHGWSTAPVLQNGEFLPWVENLLLEWHLADPVSAKEIARNNAIYTNIQHNRNPFIDNPQWVERIWGPTASVEEHDAQAPRFWMDGEQLHFDRNGQHTAAPLSVFSASGALVASSTLNTNTGMVPFQLDPGLYIIVVDDVRRYVSCVVR